MTFRIQQSRGSLPGTTSGVRANLDVSTGGQQWAQSLAGFGRNLTNLAIELDIIEADTQYTKAKSQAREEHLRFMMSLNDLEPEKYFDAYQTSLAKRKEFTPKNRRAALSYENWSTSIKPFWLKDTFQAKENKVHDNFRAVGFEERQRAIETGNFGDYFSHLAKGVRLGSYDREEAVKFRQYALEARQRYIDTQQARIKREIAEQLKLNQEAASRQFLADLWDGKLDDPQTITDALRENLITDTDAKYLRKALMEEKPPKLTLESLAEVKKAIEEIGTNTKSREDALSVLYENLDSIDPTTGKSLLNEIFSEQDKNISEIKREGRSLMEELIRDRDSYSGMFTSDERQILASAEAYLMLDSEIKKAAAEGKPFERKDILIKAIQIGRQIKAKIKAEEELKEEPSFTPAGSIGKRAPDINAKGKKIFKGAIREPKFALKGDEPEKIFDEKGVEIGLRRKDGSIFRIGYQAIFGGIKYEYTGGGHWELIE